MRVCVGLKEVAGYYHNLSDGLRAVGVDADLILLQKHVYQYDAGEKTHWLVASTQYANTNKLKLVEPLLRALVMLWAIMRYDVFIFSYGASFLRNYELPLLKLLRKRVIYVFHGSDARPPYINGAVMAADRQRTIADCIALTTKQKNKLRRIERHADVIVSYPYYGQFHEKPFVDFMLMGFPYNPPPVTPDSITIDSQTAVRILHSPSHPEGKGTFRIRDTIERLREKGYAIDFIEITKQPNQVVLAELAKCDFVIDQLYSDIFLSAFGSEASAFGKAVVMGGYGLEAARQKTALEAVPPVMMCHPDALESAVEKLIVDKNLRERLGQDAQQFIQTQWNPALVGGRFLKLIQGDIPENWICHPGEIDYWQGYGLSEAQIQKLLHELLQNGGLPALQLADKPALESLFQRLANSNEKTS